jgi:hypothetical protein
VRSKARNEARPDELVQMLRAVLADVDPALAHHPHRIRVRRPRGLGAGGAASRSPGCSAPPAAWSTSRHPGEIDRAVAVAPIGGWAPRVRQAASAQLSQVVRPQAPPLVQKLRQLADRPVAADGLAQQPPPPRMRNKSCEVRRIPSDALRHSSRLHPNDHTPLSRSHQSRLMYRVRACTASTLVLTTAPTSTEHCELCARRVGWPATRVDRPQRQRSWGHAAASACIRPRSGRPRCGVRGGAQEPTSRRRIPPRVTSDPAIAASARHRLPLERFQDWVTDVPLRLLQCELLLDKQGHAVGSGCCPRRERRSVLLFAAAGRRRHRHSPWSGEPRSERWRPRTACHVTASRWCER